MLFDVTYALVWVLVLGINFTLFNALREVLAHTRLARKRRGAFLARGALAPDAEFREIAGWDLVRTSALNDRTLVFLRPGDVKLVRAYFAYLLRRAHGRIAIVYSGPKSEAVNEALTRGGFGSGIPVLLDPDGTAAAAFRILETPSAISLDNKGRIARWATHRPGTRPSSVLEPQSSGGIGYMRTHERV